MTLPDVVDLSREGFEGDDLDRRGAVVVANERPLTALRAGREEAIGAHRVGLEDVERGVARQTYHRRQAIEVT